MEMPFHRKNANTHLNTFAIFRGEGGTPILDLPGCAAGQGILIQLKIMGQGISGLHKNFRTGYHADLVDYGIFVPYFWHTL